MADGTRSTSLTIGFVGLGNMGSVMSQNLAVYAEKQKYPKIKLWNRTRSKVSHLSEQSHSEFVETLEELAAQCDIVHGCLANDEVALSAYRRILRAGKQGLIIVDHSTLYPTTSASLREDTEASRSSFLSCPVFGPPAVARNAGLLLGISGPEEAKNVVKGYLVPTVGKAIIDCGLDPSKGSLLKLLGNSCILGTIELVSESFCLAEKTGFDTGLFYDFIMQWFPAPAWVNYGKKIRDGAFSGSTGFTLQGGMKDASYIRRLGVETSTPTPIIDQAWNHLTTAKALGGESLDWSACAAGMRVTAGLSPFKGDDFSLSANPPNGSSDGPDLPSASA